MLTQRSIALNGSSAIALPDITLGDYTIMCVASTDDVSASIQSVFGADNYSATPREAVIFQTTRSNGLGRIEGYVNGTGTMDDASTALGDGDVAIYAARRSTTSLEGWINGIFTGSALTVGSGAVDLINFRYGAHYYSGANNEFLTGKVGWFCLWDVALPKSVIQQISLQGVNPLSVLPEHIMYYIGGYEDAVVKQKIGFGQHKGENLTLIGSPTPAPPLKQVKPIPRKFALADPLPQTRSLTVEVPWTEQPPVGTKIDWRHPLSKGLVFAFPGMDASAYLHGQTVVGTISGTVSFAPQNGVIAPTTLPALSADGYINIGSLDIRGAQALTIAGWVKSDLLGTDEQTIISNWDGPTGGATLLCRIEPTDDSLEFFVAEQTDTQRGGTVSGASALTANTWHHVAFIYDPKGEGHMRCLVDGVRTGTTIAVTGELDADLAGTNVHLFTEPNKFELVDDLDGALYGWVVTKSVWSDSQVRQHRDNPWQIFKPQELHIPIEYQELTFDETAEERLFWIPQKWKEQPK